MDNYLINKDQEIGAYPKRLLSMHDLSKMSLSQICGDYRTVVKETMQERNRIKRELTTIIHCPKLRFSTFINVLS